MRGVYIKTSLWSLSSPTSGVKHEKIWRIEIFGLKPKEGSPLTYPDGAHNIHPENMWGLTCEGKEATWPDGLSLKNGSARYNMEII